jgi:hypothetical protein
MPGVGVKKVSSFDLQITFPEESYVLIIKAFEVYFVELGFTIPKNDIYIKLLSERG